MKYLSFALARTQLPYCENVVNMNVNLFCIFFFAFVY